MKINNKVIIWFLFIVSIGLIVYLFINKEEKFKSSTLCNINNDYLCNDGWKYICNNNSIIFVETQKLSDKSTIEYLHNVNYPFVLVTANNLDFSSMTKDHLPIIENPKLIHWFGTFAGEIHPKFSSIPLGPKWNWKSIEFGGKDENFEENCKILNKACKSATKSFGSINRSNFVYWNMDLATTNNPKYAKEHKNLRNTIFQSLQHNGVLNNKNIQKKDWKSYLSDLRNSVFCISPPGNGTDSHRTWEALYMGCIPVVPFYEPLNSLYEDLPIIIVNDWSTINIPFLKKKQEEIYEKNILPSSLNKLSLKYWKSKIYSMLKFRSIIVEPRPHPALKAVLQNICEKLKTPITIVHGTKNKEFVHEIISDIPCVDLVIEINAEQLNSETYSKLLTTEEFWDKTRLDEPKVLIFQTDSGICGDGSDLSKYIKYNYCGAAWIWDKKQNKGGNGGFSIRDPEIAKKHIRQYGTHTYNEDMKFSEWCIKDKACDICDYDTAKKFSTETVPSNSWAFHNNFSQGNYKSVCDFNDEIAKLNKNTPKYNYKIPDNNWKPTFTETYNNNKLNAHILINILTRTGRRQQYFNTLQESIRAQSYRHIRHIKSNDNPLCSYLDMDNVIHVKPEKNLGKAFYNLYLNFLGKEVSDGWVIILDDDSKLIDSEFIGKLAKQCERAHKTDVLIYQTYIYPSKQKIPSDKNFTNQKIVVGDIDMACFCIHHTIFKTFRFDARLGGDFNFLDKIRKNKTYNFKYVHLPNGIWANYDGAKLGV